jgi:hypothetical protein
MMSIGNTLRETAKAVVGFVTGVVGVITTRLAADEAALPDLDPFDTKGWVLLVVMGVLGYLGVYSMPNTTTDPKVAKTQSVKLRKSKHAGRDLVVDDNDDPAGPLDR